LTLAVGLLSWSAYEAWSQRRGFDRFMEVRAKVVANVLAQAIESSLEAGRSADASAATALRAQLLEILMAAGDFHAAAAASGPHRPEPGEGSLLHAAVETGAITFATILDADGRILESVAPTIPPPDGTLTQHRPVRLAPDRIGTLRVGISGAWLLAAHRSSLQTSLFVSLVGAVLIGVMAAGMLLRQAALRCQVRSERSLTEAVLAGMSDAVVVLDDHDTIRMVNPAACSLFGASRSDLAGTNYHETPCAAIVRKLAAAGAPMEIEFPRPGEPAMAVLGMLSQVGDAKEGTACRALILHDLTECHELRREENRARSLAAFARFASMVAHEVRNPLNAIAIGVQRLGLEGVRSPGTREPSRMLALIRGEVQRLDGIVSGFLDLAQPPRLDSRPGDLEDLLGQMLPLLREGAPPGVEIALRRGSIATAHFDPGAVRQIVLNLVRNAVEAVGAKGRIELVTRQVDGTVVLDVEDDGPGIAPGDRDHVFEFGFTTKPNGHGVGLPTVHRLVTEMHGSVEVQPAAGRGAKIRVRLPVAEGAVAV
jgi:signal transduction histidine kinase